MCPIQIQSLPPGCLEKTAYQMNWHWQKHGKFHSVYTNKKPNNTHDGYCHSELVTALSFNYFWCKMINAVQWSNITDHITCNVTSISIWLNRLTPNDPYMGRTAPLTSKRCILYIYSTNIGTEYFKHALYSPFFFFSSKCSLFRNANFFGSCIIHIFYTGCA